MINHRLSITFFILALWLGAPSSIISAQGPIQVPGDFSSIQEAIDSAINGDVIAVAPGTYFENIDFEGKAITVQSSAGPAVTIIDGANCTSGILTCSVVTFSNGEGPDSILDGFTITGGYGTSAGGGVRDGGGMIIVLASPTIMNCEITGNTARNGGGALCSSGDPTWISCTFSENHALNGNGGGLANTTTNATFFDCTFENNIADNRGGGLHNQETTSTIMNCTFSENTALIGGGVYNTSGGTPFITGSLFYRNEATGVDGGGGIINSSTGPGVVISRCRFVENTARNGGGIMNRFSSPSIDNCLLIGNSATGVLTSKGGGIYHMLGTSGTSTQVTNCTITENTAGLGAGTYNEAGLFSITNSIIWENNPSEIGGPTMVSYSCLTIVLPGPGNISSDPLFVDFFGDDGIAGTVDDNLRLSDASPCIDQGTDSPPLGLAATDLDGGPRVECVTVDMGAYEFDGCVTNFVRGDTNGDGLTDISDVTFNLQHQFMGGAAACLDAHDLNDDGVVDIADVIFELNDLFLGGPSPSAPFPDCGGDPSFDDLECSTSSACP